MNCTNEPGYESQCNGEEWWGRRCLAAKIAMGIGFGILGIALIFGFGFLVMKLWNALMPDIFGLKEISYWQAWGLFLLSTILFKGFGSGGGHGKTERRRKNELKRHLSEMSAGHARSEDPSEQRDDAKDRE